MLATEKGKQYALDQLRQRRERNAEKTVVDNSRLPAGSPMYFRCKTCGEDIVVAENYIFRPQLCSECKALETAGWLE
jgi:Zn finger protein HypA/HybF involved in hydrogenase expression